MFLVTLTAGAVERSERFQRNMQRTNVRWVRFRASLSLTKVSDLLMAAVWLPDMTSADCSTEEMSGVTADTSRR